MRMVQTTQIAPSKITTSPPELYPVWTAGTYLEGVRLVHDGRVWEAQASTDDQPDLGAVLPTPTWLDVGPSNKLAAFDQRNTTPCVRQDGQDLVLRFSPGIVATTIALFRVRATAGYIRAFAPGQAAPFFEEPLQMRDFAHWVDLYYYFFTPWTESTQFIHLDLRPVEGVTYEVALSPESGKSEVGEIIVGTARRLGRLQPEFSATTMDFSKVARDEFGNLDIIKREAVPHRSVKFYLEPSQAGFVDALLREMSGTKTVVVADDRLPWMTTFGVIGDSALNSFTFFDKAGNQQGVVEGKLDIEGVAG